MYKKFNLTPKDFDFVCPLKTTDMKIIDGGHFCQECQKKVYDVSKYTEESFHALAKKENNLCVSFTKVSTVSIVLALSACTTTPTPPQAPLLGKIVIEDKGATCNTNKHEKANKLAPFKVPKRNIHIPKAKGTAIDADVVEIAGGIQAPILPVKASE